MAPERNLETRHYQALLAMTDVIVRHRSLPELFRELSERLHEVVSFDLANFALYDPQKHVMRIRVFEGKNPILARSEVAVDKSPGGWVWQHQKSLLLHDASDPHLIALREIFEGRNIRTYCALPLTTAQHRLGSLGFGSSREGAYADADLKFLTRVADLVALALENVIAGSALLEEKERLQILLQISIALSKAPDVASVFPSVSRSLRKLFHLDYTSITIWDVKENQLRKYAEDSNSGRNLTMAGPISRESPQGMAFLAGEGKVYRRKELQELNSPVAANLLEQGIQSLACFPLANRQGALGVLSLASSEAKAFVREDVNMLRQVAAQLAGSLENQQAYQEIAALSERLQTEKLYLQDEIRSEHNFGEIVGESAPLKKVLGLVATVAPSDTTVLILGETGTGKELVARAVHRMSSRKDASFIKLNCAAIPTGLLESELFGHEKGAFTGAVSQKLGRMELADGGTLFLDEVGEIPLELQPKLLRVLQDHEFERLGGTKTIKVNVRLVAATNRDLVKGVAEKEFRSDLYYRLNVFPVRMPPLRERGNDIPLLVRYFTQTFARRMNRVIETIPADAMEALKGWHWPGNIRELENFVERSVILSEGRVLNVPLAELNPQTNSGSCSTLEMMEREHILRVLRETGGVIAGVRGAAARLGLKRTTLQSRMQKMGITRAEYEN